DNQILTTQDIIFFSLGVSDISQGQADEYVSQLEALIKKYNETFEDFMVEIVNQSSQIQNDLNTMSRKAKELKTQMDGLQEQIAALDLDAWKDEVLKTSKGYTDSKYEEASQTFVAQESLEAGPLLFKNTQITTQDWNDITESGIYYCAAATGENMPYSGKLYGFLTVYNELAVIIQKYEFQGAVYMRTFAGNPATWGSWLKFVTSKEMEETLEVEISKAKKDIYSLGEWKILTLASGYKGAEGTTPKYRINTVNGRHNVVFNGAITTTTETLPSQGQQHVIAVLPDELIPTITKMGVGATGLFTTTCRIAVATNGNLYIGNDSGKDVKYCYLDLFQYWLD
ncbi:pyocin knob domain-containing protein, partial [Klebsiella grimontii]